MSGLRQMEYMPAGPIAEAFLYDDSFVCGIMGPVGSGKTTAAIAKCLMIANKQRPDQFGRRRSRGAIIRNSYPELNTTTIKSWHEWVSKEAGHWQAEGPPTHTLRGPDGFECEIMFLALDSPEDVRKVLSMDLTFAYINEAREVPKPIVDGLTARVGRYPPGKDKDGVRYCVDPQILLDTNAPDSDHWYYILAENDRSTAYARMLHDSTADAERELKEAGLLRPDQPLFRFHKQPGGRSPLAENLENLRPGYYSFMAAGKSADWLRVYRDAEYGFVRDGKPVYPEYVDSVHCALFELDPTLPISIGIDFGLTPAATISQVDGWGRKRVRAELVTEDMGAVGFAAALKRKLDSQFRDYKFSHVTGDPAGTGRVGTDKNTPLLVMRAGGFPDAAPAWTNDFIIRRDAVGALLLSAPYGEPGLLIHPDCAMLRKGMAGKYCLDRVGIVGVDKFKDKPSKNMWSHVCEALQYDCLGDGGGHSIVTVPKKPKIKARAYASRPATGEGSWM